MKFIIDSNTILDLICDHVSSVIEVKPDVLVSTMFLENGDVEITLTPVEDNSTPAKVEPKPVAKKPASAAVTKEAKKEEPAEEVTNEETEEIKEEEPKKPSPFAKKGALGNNPLFKDSSEDEVVTEEEPPFKKEDEEEGKKKNPFSFAKLGQPKND